MATKKVNFSDMEKGLDGLDDIFSYKNEKNDNKTRFEEIPLEEIQLDPKGEFPALFPLEEENIQNIAGSMKKKGFKKNQALELITLEDEGITVLGDGHNRREAAFRAGITKVPVYRSVYSTRKEAKIAMIEHQLYRRNLNDAAKFKAVSVYLELKGEKRSESGKLSEQIAEATGFSTRQVEKISSIKKSGNEELIKAVENGEKSTNQAYKELHPKTEKKKSETETPENKKSESPAETPDIKPSEDTVEKRNVALSTSTANFENLKNPVSQEIKALWENWSISCKNENHDTAEDFYIYLLSEFEKLTPKSDKEAENELIKQNATFDFDVDFGGGNE